MSQSFETALQEHFGFDRFRPGQQEVIESLMAGRSAAAVFPTGSGKSLCYQLPALLLDGVTLVVSPLIALMKDQIDALQARGILARRLDSTLSADDYREVMEQLRGGQLRMLYVAPERFNNERFRQLILQTPVALFAVDEAHCISEWGHNFRPDYLKLAEFARRCGAGRVLALTATATPEVLKDIREAFEIEPGCATCTGFYRENLTLLTTPVPAAERDGLLTERLGSRDTGPTIIYVTLQRTAEEVAERLSREGFPAKAYHAGMKPDRRAAVQEWFLESEDGIVVATIAFGMGVDKPDIRYIYHYNLPKSLENYSQEIGRAGRDGVPSICELFLSMEDLNVLENFAYGDTPTRESVGGLVEEIFSHEGEFDVSYYELSSVHDIRILVVRTLLTYLELDGYIEGGTPFYSKYQFRPLMSSQEILAKFEGPRRDFLAGLFRQAKKAKTWLHIDLDRAAAATDSPRERVVRALDYLGEQQMLEVRVQGVRNRYTIKKPCRDPQALAEQLHAKTQQRQDRDVARLQQVLDWAAQDDCQVAALCGHFGETLDQRCGHCSWCQQGVAITLPSRPRPALADGLLGRALSLRKQHPQVLDDPRQIARLLCGTASPQLSRAKLSSHELFGAAAEVPFAAVADQAAKAMEG